MQEDALKAIWSKFLKVHPDVVTSSSDFFELGGTSLVALRITAQIRKDCGRDVRAPDLIENPVFSQFAGLVAHAAVAEPISGQEV